MFQNHHHSGISKAITNCQNREPSLDDLIKAECKYRSVQWYKNSLTLSEKQSLSVIHFNVRSLVKNTHLLEELLIDLDQCPSILAISETKLNDDKVSQAMISNYNFFFSNSNTNAGGVGLYVKSDLITTRRQDLEFDSNNSENLFIEIRLASKKVVVIGVIYRHPTRVGKNRLQSIFDINILYFLFIECIGAFTFLNEYRIWPCLYFFSG